MMLWICLDWALAQRSPRLPIFAAAWKLLAVTAQMTPFKDINVAQRLSADDFRCWQILLQKSAAANGLSVILFNGDRL